MSTGTEREPAPGAPIPPLKRKYVRAVGPRLRILLYGILGLFAILGANSVYLASITFLEWSRGLSYQNYFYMVMFGIHLVLGLLLILPVVIFGILHIKNSHDRPNRRAVSVGYSLFVCSIALLFSGIALMRFDFFSIKNPNIRGPIYWAHVITPIVAIWLYILHRLAGPRIRWKIGAQWAAVVGALVLGSVLMHSQHPKLNVAGPKEGERYFLPSAARTGTGNFIPAQTLMMDDYCKKCHPDSYEGWFHSSHRFSSFNNPAYLFSVKETREVSLKRDGSVRASRWCAGCHDVVPFFSGAFDDPNFDINNHPTAKAGITCTACHGMTHVDSTIGNAAYTIEEPVHYPFAYSTNQLLQWVNNTLVKAKPAFHKQTFLKPFMRSAEYCSVCHKVSLPREVTQYKDWLRGQNHYDTFVLSGAGHGARSFYYPPKAEQNCNGCHMPLQKSEDFGANFFNPTNQQTRFIHDHLFPSANTALPFLRGEAEIVKRHEAFGDKSVRVDIFAIKEDGLIDGAITAPLRPKVPALKRGKKYLLEVVLRTLRVAHPFSQGTVDSNEIWVDVAGASGGKVVARSGGLGEHKEVDPWSHFVNVYMLDKDGNRIDRRNPQDIFTPLYNNQIPPGAGQVVHYEFTVPEDASEPIVFTAKLDYRKFDAVYVNYFQGKDYKAGQPLSITNDLPVRVISSDRIVFPIEGVATVVTNAPSAILEWQRWNDYGIGLLNKGEKGSEKGELVQASQAFEQVEKLGRFDGPVNLARVYFKEGRLDEAVEALQRASKSTPPAPRWTVAWFNGQVNKQNGYLDKAITEFRSILEDRYPELDQRGFNFSTDYEVLNELGQTYFERSKLERGDARKPQREDFLQQAVAQFKKTLAIDSENLAAHYNLALIYGQLGDAAKAEEHRQLHEKYRPDDNARDRAVTAARLRDPAADHATQATVIYPLQRAGAFGLSPTAPRGQAAR
ncbi:MAG: tetratricopeptide repeat protein [Verrucomicrobia bacterium]|nr:tetratricopeptide repeat protein [Verrucomicrobiota bacterium]MBI3869421.1 tetratricopeptide repeat protein [Verrucomicrobiota bacterium]